MSEQNEIKMCNKLFPHFILQLPYYFRISFPTAEHGRHPIYVCVSYMYNCSAHAYCLTKFSKLLSIFVPHSPRPFFRFDRSGTDSTHKIFDMGFLELRNLHWGRKSMACADCDCVSTCQKHLEIDFINYAKNMW